jgi:HEAT repeat protein
LDELIELLGDARPAVQKRAIDTLARAAAKEDAVARLREIALHNPSPVVRRNTVWTLSRIDHSDARALARSFLSDPDETVRQAALQRCAAFNRAPVRAVFA